MIDHPFRLRIEDTPEHKALIEFIKKNNLDMTKKTILLNSLSAFWMPFAIKQQNPNDNELKQHAIAAIYKLQQQIEFISKMFNLDSPTSSKPPESINIDPVNHSLDDLFG